MTAPDAAHMDHVATYRGYEIAIVDLPIPSIGAVLRGLAIRRGDKCMAHCCDSESYARHVIDSKIKTGEWPDVEKEGQST